MKPILSTRSKMILWDINYQYKIIIEHLKLDGEGIPRYNIILLQFDRSILNFQISTTNLDNSIIVHTNEMIKEYNKKFFLQQLALIELPKYKIF